MAKSRSRKKSRRNPRHAGCKKGYYRPRGSKGCIKGITVRKGRLSKFVPSGKPYTTLSADQRHTVLRKAIREYGAGTVVRMLNAPAILLKRTSPGKAAKFEADKRWVQRHHLGKSPKRRSSVKKRRRSKRRSRCRYGRTKSGRCKKKPGPKRRK